MSAAYVYLGRSGLRVSRLCLGTMNFGGPTDEAAAREMITAGKSNSFLRPPITALVWSPTVRWCAAYSRPNTNPARSQHALDRHWRNARTHTLHDPVRWKYAILGNYHLNGVNPPLHAWS